MARLFDDGSSQYLYVDSAGTTDVPVTMACWFNTNDDTAHQTMMWIGDKDNAQIYASLNFVGDGGDIVRARTRDTLGADANADTTTSANANEWNHACGVWAGDASRSAYLNGGGKGTNNNDLPQSAVWDRMGIGAAVDSSISLYMSGGIAEAAIWNVALTDAEVESLAAGVSPLLVRPASLVAYWPLIRDEDQDRVGGYHMTPVNSPTIATHPPRVKPYWYIPWTAGVPTGAVECTTVTITVPVTVVDMDC